MIRRLLTAYLFLLWAPGILGAQVVFSRRVYAKSGREDGSTAGVWSFDRKTRQEREIFAGPYALLGIAKDGGPLVTKDRDIVSEEQKQDVYVAGPKPRRLASACGAAVSPEGLRLAFHECSGAGLFVTGMAVGSAPVRIGECDGPAWSRDGRRIACVAGQNIVVIDVVSKREAERVRFHGWPMPPGAARAESLPEAVEWAPDGTALLVATLGKNSNSSQPQSDFFVLGLSAKTWTAAGSGNDAGWAPGGRRSCSVHRRSWGRWGQAGMKSGRRIWRCLI
jgi:hypothetical protein